MAARRKNIIVTSAGRRVELIEAFKTERSLFSPATQILAIDANPGRSAASQVADQSFACPRNSSPEYIPFVAELARKHDVGLIVPTIDTELVPLANAASALSNDGIHVAIPDVNFVASCRDKRRTGSLFNSLGIRYPDIYSTQIEKFPVFAKPADGSSSIGARIVDSSSQLEMAKLDCANLLIMEYIGPPYCEYTIDIYFDKHSRLCCAVPRKRLETRAGEVSKGLTVRHCLYEQLIRVLPNWRGARGCVTMQVFYDENSADVVGLEINPRFGGGYPLSYAAGARFPAWLIAEYILGQDVKFFSDWENNLLMLRYDAKVLLHDAS